MRPTVNEMCNWLGTVDAECSAMMEEAVNAGLCHEANVKALQACVTHSLVFVCQLIRCIEAFKADAEPGALPKRDPKDDSGWAGMNGFQIEDLCDEDD